MSLIIRWAATAALALGTAAAFAAPDTSAGGEVVPQPSADGRAPASPQGAPRVGADPAAGADSQYVSKTVQMLLEIQDTKTQPEGSQPPRADRGVAARTPPPAGEAAAFGTQRAGLPSDLGDGRGAPVQAQPGQGDVSWSGAPQAVAVRQASVVNQPEESGVDVRGWMPTSLLQFVRENREIVALVCLCALALAAWLATPARRS